MNLADEEVTLGEVFKTKNYTTACVGKWGLGGPSAEGHPNKQGFDYFDIWDKETLIIIIRRNCLRTILPCNLAEKYIHMI